MTVKKRVSHRSLKSDLKRVDAHVVKANEYVDLPENAPYMETAAVCAGQSAPASARVRARALAPLNG